MKVWQTLPISRQHAVTDLVDAGIEAITGQDRLQITAEGARRLGLYFLADTPENRERWRNGELVITRVGFRYPMYHDAA